MNLNKVQLAGRLTRDPEIRHTTSGFPVADLSLAVSRFYKNDQGETKEETDFIDVTAFGTTATTIQKHLRKGRAVYVEGRLKLDQWEKDGQKRSKLKVIAESMQFVGPKPQAPIDEPKPTAALLEQREARARFAGQTAATAAPAQPARAADADVEPNDIPF